MSANVLFNHSAAPFWWCSYWFVVWLMIPWVAHQAFNLPDMYSPALSLLRIFTLSPTSVYIIAMSLNVTMYFAPAADGQNGAATSLTISSNGFAAQPEGCKVICHLSASIAAQGVPTLAAFISTISDEGAFCGQGWSFVGLGLAGSEVARVKAFFITDRPRPPRFN
ncbi:hypothetical protein CROQUDRAFT_88056 [Cronartium quercuum f. sp. fusiforme G11]|uniref:Uncharacterized protein n=1 Tax=Cronartium quercuum f. sp. fusiforme G11 TaxID=708437 RepID=A0A9P6NRE7_9BASI|nr:hypothetical protein CROQUDRAFT_88056 [Cronartium quercuum f. sp. fusiforme G11]